MPVKGSIESPAAYIGRAMPALPLRQRITPAPGPESAFGEVACHPDARKPRLQQRGLSCPHFRRWVPAFAGTTIFQVRFAHQVNLLVAGVGFMGFAHDLRFAPVERG